MKINSVDDLRGVLWACNARLNDSPNGGRDAAKTALLALMLFAERALGEDLDRRLMTAPAKLLGALYDLDEGAIDKMLKPVTLGHRAKAGLLSQVMKAYVAAAVHILHKSCDLLVPDACRYASDALTRKGVQRDSGKPIGEETVRSWRKDAMEGPGDSVLVTEYLRCCAMQPAASETWKDLVDRMLGFAAEELLLDGRARKGGIPPS